MKRIYLIDASSFIYRMFYGVPEMKTKSGEVVNAIFGMARFFLVQMKYENPDYLIFIKDAKWKNFRHELDENYKATRDKMPDNLRSQMPVIYDMIEKMWIPSIEIQGYEADDVIWTLANKYNWETDCEVDILSWDKDLYSLVSKNVCIYDTMKKKKFGIEETKEKFWVEPKMIIDYLAIVGDKADNIPGIDWFWPQKAVNLINIIWTIEDIYNFIDENKIEEISEKERKNILEEKFWEENAKKLFSMFKWKTFEKLINSRENAFLSKKLATIELNVELDGFSLENFKFLPENYLTEEVKELFRKLEFNSLIWEEAPKQKKWDDLWLKVKIVDSDEKLEKLYNLIAPSNPPLKGEKNPLAPFSGGTIDTIVLDTETTSLDIMKAKLVWVSIYINDSEIYYINRLHKWNSVSDEKLKDFLRKLFDLDITIVGHNIKFDLEIIDLFLKQENEVNWEKKLIQESLF